MKLSLVNVIEEYEANATRGAELASERAKAMDYYLGRPLGNEVVGRSAVVSRDVADSIEWIKPGILRVFTAGDEILNFTPKSQEDVDAAQQETDFVNYIITQKNNWFNTAYVWFTDALLQKNGYVKAYWDERIDTEKETYKGVTDDQLALVAADAEVEITAHREYEMPVTFQTGQGPQQQLIKLHDITVQKKVTYGCVKMVNLPPERVIVSVMHQCVDLDGADFVEHWEWKTLSELRKEGFEVPDDIGDVDETTPPEDEEELARNRFGEDQDRDSDTTDPAMRRVKARECWLRFDEDGDGLAELRHCLIVGTTVLLNEECDLVPVAAITPRIMPHRHIGISVADAVMDIQIIKSTLQRGYLDNVYLSVNGRHGIDKNKVNLEDMLTSRPGGVVRTDGSPHESLMPLTQQSDFQAVLAGIQYFDVVREERTGSSKQQQLSPEVLSKAPSGIAIAQLMNAGQALVELIARVFAETGVKRLFQIVHALTLKNATQAEVVRLRNKWVTVDPREWKNRADMTISVGLGTGNKEQQAAGLQQLVGLEMQLLPTGLSNLKTVRHALTKLTQAQGFKDVESFWVPEDKIPPPQPQQDPKAALEAARMQQESQQADADRRFEAWQTQFKAQQDSQQQAMEARIRAADDARQAAFDKWKTEFDASVKIAIAQISAKNSIDTTLLSAEMAANREVDEELANVGEAKVNGRNKPIDRLAQMHEQQAQMHGQTLEVFGKMIEQQGKPKRIVRDPQTGRATGVETVN